MWKCLKNQKNGDDLKMDKCALTDLMKSTNITNFTEHFEMKSLNNL